MEKELNDEKLEKTSSNQVIRNEKGQVISGTPNPNGRPAGTKNFDTLFKEAIKKIAKEEGDNELGKFVKDADKELIKKALLEARKGNYNFFKDIYDRRLGKAIQPVEFDDPEAMEEIEKLRNEIKKWLNVK